MKNDFFDEAFKEKVLRKAKKNESKESFIKERLPKKKDKKTEKKRKPLFKSKKNNEKSVSAKFKQNKDPFGEKVLRKF